MKKKIVFILALTVLSMSGFAMSSDIEFSKQEIKKINECMLGSIELAEKFEPTQLDQYIKYWEVEVNTVRSTTKDLCVGLAMAARRAQQ